MIPLNLAVQLKEAGLVWQTSLYDFFGIPDRDLDDRTFVISDMMVTMELLQGWPAVTFHGTAEWAADYLWTHEAVWLPREDQLRDEFVRLLNVQELNHYDLRWENGRYLLCWSNEQVQGETATEAYAYALLQLYASQKV